MAVSDPETQLLLAFSSNRFPTYSLKRLLSTMVLTFTEALVEKMTFLNSLARSEGNNAWHKCLILMITVPKNKGSRENSQREEESSVILVMFSKCFLSLSDCSSLPLCLRRICCAWSTLSTVSRGKRACCSLAGYDYDNSIVFYCPPCLPCTTPVLPFTQSFSWESPACLLLITTFITANALYVS